MKDYCVCEEKINDKWSEFYSIRDKNDCSPFRFRVIASFDTFEEAQEYIDKVRLPRSEN